MAGLRRAINFMFQPRYLLATNIGTSGLLMGLGDVIAQRIERRITPAETDAHDWKRTGNFILIGFAIGPVTHGYYTILDRLLPAINARTIAKKIIADEVIASPMFMYLFFTGLGKLDGKTHHECWTELKAKFWTVYKVDLMVWPVAQAINFSLVPAQFRVLYVYAVTLCWNSFLSYVKEKEYTAETTITPAVGSQTVITTATTQSVSTVTAQSVSTVTSLSTPDNVIK